jgi:16S rRNA (guanine966-N2)-methyltransferase
MRIIGGQASGQILKFPKSKKTRPITDRAKEAIFSILRNEVKDTFVLDLYAGSGSLGIEALSRGAKKVTFVDKDKVCVQIIKQNLTKINLLEKGEVKKEKVEKFLHADKQKYDLIFFDPPWQEIDLKILSSLKRFLKPKGIIILRHRYNFDLKTMTDLFIYDQRKYGDSGVTFLKLYPVK